MICFMGKKLVISIVLGVLREVIKWLVFDLTEFVKVSVLIIRVLDATDKFSNPAWCVIALISL